MHTHRNSTARLVKGPDHLDRAVRVEVIRRAALVRAALGQSALYQRLPDGRHQVTLRGSQYIGPTLQEAVDLAREAQR